MATTEETMFPLERSYWEPYSGPDADVVEQSRRDADGSNILYRVEKALGSMYFAATDESDEATLLAAKFMVRDLRHAL